MARKSEFYKGRRKKRNYAFIPFVILLAVAAFLMVSFYGMQKYAVVTKDGVNVELPILNDRKTTVDSEGNTVLVFDPVDAPLVIDPPDYFGIEPLTGRNVPPMRAIFVPAENITEEKLAEYSKRLSMGNALVLEMKPRMGQLMFLSQSEAASRYGMSAMPDKAAELQGYINKLSEDGVYLVAQISCCIDDMYASRSTTVSLKTGYGMNYMDEEGLWLDPYNLDVRNYVVQLCRELYDMGFDEVVLADLRHPVIERGEDEKPPEQAENQNQIPDFVYTRDMSTEPGPVNAVCGFALSVATELQDRGEGLLSIYTYTPPSLVKADTGTGQDATLFMKIFDRVYYPTDKFAYSYNLGDIKGSVLEGDVNNRFVPVVINMLPPEPENISWVLIDKVKETDEE